jgi:hypothetical protein
MHRPSLDHLAAERLAALAEDELTTGEAGHIGSCEICARELTAQRHLRAMARDAAHTIGAPLTSWERLAPALRDAGLLGDTPVVVMPAARNRRRPTVLTWAGRAAAAALFLSSGLVLGRISAGAPVSVAGLGLGGRDTIIASTDSTLGRRDDSVPIFRSPAEALATLSRAEQAYRHAAVYLLTTDSSADADDRRETYRTRLAALDEVAQTTRAALDQAPHDPVLNQYYLSSVSAREATLRQLGGALPVGMRLDRY